MTNAKLLYNQIRERLINVKKNDKYYEEIIDFAEGKGYILNWEKDDENNVKSRVITTKEYFKKLKKMPNDKKYDILENKDYQEILNQIRQIRKLRDKQYKQNCRDIEEKLNSVPGLYYYGSSSKPEWNRKRADSWFDYGDKKGGYYGLLGNKNGRTHYLNINENHPILDSFPFQKGYYLIDCSSPIEKNLAPLRPWSDGGNKNPNNFHRWVELNDEITITPYNEKENIQLTLTAKPGNKKFLTSTFQTNNIKKVVLNDNGNLTITNNNNNTTFSAEQVNNDWELLPIKNYLIENNRKELKQEELFITTTPKNNNILWIGGTVGILTIGVVAILLVRKKNSKK